MKRTVLALAFAASLVALTTAAGQAQTYPTKTIKIVVPYPAGGPTDLVGRTLAEALTKALKKTVIVENKVGAGGTIGSDSVVKSAPDGYTLLLGLMGPMSIAPKIAPNLPYDPLKDLAPIRLVAIMPEVLVARPTLGLKTLGDVVAYGKANPGKLTIASAGNGSLPHLAAELLKRETGIDAMHVPYRGAAPAVNDLLGGQVDLMFGDGPVVLPQILGNLLVPVVMATDKRLPACQTFQHRSRLAFPLCDPRTGMACWRRKERRARSSKLSTRPLRRRCPSQRSKNRSRSSASISSRTARPRRSARSSQLSSTNGVAWRKTLAPK